MRVEEPYAVITRELTMRYGRQVALEGVELRVPEGAVYVLVGENGAGKSTTLKVLMNLERADAGCAEVFGKDTAARGAEVRAQIGYVPEHASHPYRWLRCRELLAFTASYYPTWDHAYADHLGGALGVDLQRRVGTLSKGELRRLQLILAMAHRPPLLLLDEPTDGLDPLARKRTLTLLAEHLADTPTTVVISTHQIYELESLADHVGVLSKGRLVAQISRDDLRRTVRRYFLDIPDDWTPPADLQMSGVRRAGRQCECTIVGDEHAVTSALVRSNAQVRESKTLSLEDAAIVFLTDEVAQ